MTFVGEAREKTRSGRDMPQMETISAPDHHLSFRHNQLRLKHFRFFERPPVSLALAVLLPLLGSWQESGLGAHVSGYRPELPYLAGRHSRALLDQ